MSDDKPTGDSFSREALERIIHRAAELQAAEREIGDGLTEEEVKQLGREVGLPARYVQQSLIEERQRLAPGSGRLAAWMGPTRIQARRTVAGNPTDVSAALEHWLTANELLVVKRRYPDRTSWESRSDFLAGIRRHLGLGGRRYMLSRARELVTQVESLESGWCHVSLAADLSTNRMEYAVGATVLGSGGGLGTVIALTLGIAAPVAIVPALAGVALGAVVLRNRRGIVERIQVALEQILDRLERGEIRKPVPPPPRQGLLPRAIVDEVRKRLGS